jgi:HEPN domain-containing protein
MARFPALPPVLWESLCFHAQQAAEKAIKAVLIRFGVEPPRIHDIRGLIERLPADLPQHAELRASAELTDYAALARYPWQGEPASEEDYREAVRLAEAVVAWAEEVIGGSADL